MVYKLECWLLLLSYLLVLRFEGCFLSGGDSTGFQRERYGGKAWVYKKCTPKGCRYLDEWGWHGSDLPVGA